MLHETGHCGAVVVDVVRCNYTTVASAISTCVWHRDPAGFIVIPDAEDAENAEVAEDCTPDLLLIHTSPDECFGNDLGKPIRPEVVSSSLPASLQFRGYSAAAA